MATLGTQNISTTFPQVLKTFGSNIVDGTLRAIASGDEAGVSALQISTTGAKSTGTFAVDGATTLTGAVTFGSTITASTGTNTLGTISGNIATLGTLSVTNGAVVTTTATVGTARIGAAGPSLTRMTYATAAYTGGTVQDLDHVTGGSNISTGTFAATGVALGDIVIGSLNSLGSATGVTPARLIQNYRVEAADVVRFTILNTDQTAGTIPSGTLFATAIRLTV